MFVKFFLGVLLDFNYGNIEKKNFISYNVKI